MRERLLKELENAVRTLWAETAEPQEPPSFALESARQEAHGDFACNAAMVLAKKLRRPPRQIADQLITILGDAGGLIERAEVAGPGFVNLWLARESWRDALRGIIEAGPDYGRASDGEGKPVQVEFVSANPTGPLSSGHGRQAVLGDCIARLLQFCGFEVTREYYFNDGGRQMKILGESVKARYLEALGRAAAPPAELLNDSDATWPDRIDDLPVVFPRDGYQGVYVKEIAAALRAEYGDGIADEPGEGIFREKAEKQIFDDILRSLDALGIAFDVFFNEKSLYDNGKLDETLSDLRERNLVYESDGATWLKSSALGLDRDRVLIKSGGDPTYLLPDIAYHREKFRRGFELVIDVMGADHKDQFPFVRAAVGALDCDPGRLELVMHQFVTLTSGGKKVKQSTRRATFVTVDELLEQVGLDVFRFFMIERKADGHLDFDVDLARDRNWRKNPAYYVQYGHARTYGIERTAAEQGVSLPDAKGFDASRLKLPEELELIRKLSEFPGVVRRAGAAREPHHLAYYLRDVAGLWNPYVQDRVRHRVVSKDSELSAARLALVRGVRTVLSNGLQLLGISTPERM